MTGKFKTHKTFSKAINMYTVAEIKNCKMVCQICCPSLHYPYPHMTCEEYHEVFNYVLF